MKRLTDSEIRDAYRHTGSVWAAGQRLGIAGQTVHKRLGRMGEPTTTRWQPGELARLTDMVADGHSHPEIAIELGRTPAGIACKMNALGLKVTRRERSSPKRNWATQLTADVCAEHVARLIETGEPVTRYARKNSVPVGALVAAFCRHVPHLWETYRSKVSGLPIQICTACNGRYTPLNTRQQFCSPRCTDRHRSDQAYFGGRRSTTVGLDEGVCVLCGRDDDPHISSHHVLGKEHDPDNDHLVALCRGCHKAVTFLASREWVLDEDAWARLIHLSTLRAAGDAWSDLPEHHRPDGCSVSVELRPAFPPGYLATLPHASELFPERYIEDAAAG